MHNKKNNTNKTTNFIQGLRPFSSSLPQGLKKILRKGGYNFSSIVDNWSKVVGQNISSNCYPSSIKMGKEMNNGTLVVNVIHGNELEVEYKKKEIIEKINSFFGYRLINKIKLKIVQEKRNLIKKKLNIINNERDDLNKKLEKIKNENLKKSLNKLIKAHNDKKN
tara:strand:+ start:1019 stop:1513 length:495 start_codon:yes stop_codon:yes gene_type:complete